MKYIKLFESYRDIESICQKYSIENYTINNDQSIDVNDNVYLFDMGLIEIPLQFGKINGYFTCAINKLTFLKGSPNYVDRYFNCRMNRLNTLEYSPKYIGNYFNFGENNIYSLDGIGNVGDNIYFDKNPIVELVFIFKNNIKLYMEYQDIYNFQRGNKIIKIRFMEALEDLGVKELPHLKNYIYV